MEIRGAEIILETLVDLGVKDIFGYPGGAVLDIYDALYDYQDKLHHVLTCHEQGASHAADGYARSTGRTGVCIATSGPGATNLVTGIATAYMDSVPMVCITGNVGRPLIGKDSFQEIYITGITMPITKHNFVVREIENLQDIIIRAFEIANTGRKGPVLVDIPKDIMQDFYRYEKKEANPQEESYDIDNLEDLARLINESQRPVLYVGGGVIASGATEEARQVIQKAKIPACHSILGTGVLAYGDPLNLGMVGMHGSLTSNMAIEESDLLIACGVRFSDRVAAIPKKFAPQAKIIHVDIDQSEFSKNVWADYIVHSDAKYFLGQLLDHIRSPERQAWLDRLEDFRKRDYQPVDRDEIIRPHQLLRTIAESLGPEDIIVTDVGQQQMWAAQFSQRTSPRSFLTSAGLGTMGYGLGAAIGAKVGNPDKKVVLITGDGSFHMNLNEIATAVSEELDLRVVIVNNQSLGMVRQWQSLLYDKRYSETDYFRKTDFVALAQAFGAQGFTASNLEEFEACWQASENLQGPVIIEAMIDRDELVLPMIPAGATARDIIVD